MDAPTTPDDEATRANDGEKRQRFIQNAIEFALSLGDFQKEIDCECRPQTIASEAIGRIGRLIEFDVSAICLVDEETSDMRVSVCTPSDAKRSLEEELSFFIQNGFIAWAIRERRGIIVNSSDGNRQILLHVLATYARIRGLFIGIFPEQRIRLPDASLEVISLILRNAVNSIESVTYSSMLQQQKEDLETQVAQKTQQLIRYEKQLAQAQHTEAIAALAGGVAHQFNNALTGLMGNLDLISMCVDSQSKSLPYIERTRPIVERMSELTSQLLAYARGSVYLTQTISLNGLFDEIMPTIHRAVKESVVLDVALSDASTLVDIDLIQMRTVFLAIVSNADEAIVEAGKISITSRLVKRDEIPGDIRNELKPGDYACISFRDDGIGMNSDTLRRLFEPFFSTKFEGRGLSMAAVSSIVKSHSGWIAVSSQSGQGSHIQIYLPTASPEQPN